MGFYKQWISPLLAACLLFFAGVIFGIGMPFALTTPQADTVFSGMTAFGTLLLALFALKGLNEWAAQNRALKKSERAEKIMPALFEVEDSLNDLYLHSEVAIGKSKTLIDEELSESIAELTTLLTHLLPKALRLKEHFKALHTQLIWFASIHKVSSETQRKLTFIGFNYSYASPSQLCSELPITEVTHENLLNVLELNHSELDSLKVKVTFIREELMKFADLKVN